MSTARFITPTILVAFIVGWVLVLMPVVSTPYRTGLYLSRANGWFGPTNFAIFDYGGERISSHSPGYAAQLTFYARYPFDESGEFLPPNQRSNTYQVLDTSDTDPLVLFPVASGMIGLSLICFGFINNKSNRPWLILSVIFGYISAVLGWTAWGFAFKMTYTIASNLARQMTEEEVQEYQTVVQRGNAIWPAFVGLLLITLAPTLVIVKLVNQGREKRLEGDEDVNPVADLGWHPDQGSDKEFPSDDRRREAPALLTRR